jgi:hypothetical protein
MIWHYIFYSDILTSYRVFVDRIKKHPILTVFFGFIAIGITWMIVNISIRLQNMDWGEEPVYIERWVFSIVFFSFIFGKVALYTYRKVLKEREMLTLFSQPVEITQIMIGKFLANFFYISVLLLTGFLLIYSWIIIEIGFIGIPLDILAEGLLLGLLGLSLGYTIPIQLQLKPFTRKVLHLSSNVMLIGIVSIPIRFFIRDAVFFTILVIITIVSYILVAYTNKFTLSAWLAQLSKPLASDEAGRDRLIADAKQTGIISKHAWLVAKKELILLIREKDAIVTIIAAVFLSVASVAVYLYYGPEGVPNTSMGVYMYPGLLAVFMFLGTLMISALIGLAMISVEGRALYIIKSLPVHNLDVLKGKSLALLIIGFPIIIPMSFILPMVAQFPIHVTLFFIILSLVFVTSFTGIGIWGGTRFPNFDTTTRNMPDIMSQFFIMTVCIICTLFIGGIPAFIMIQNNIIGILAILVALGWAVTILIVALDRGQVGYEQIGSDQYM